jgi:alpha-methylacyl-CoA racemase
MGPLKGVKVIELAGIGPGPFCCMLLADMGADVLRIDRPGGSDLGVGVPPGLDLLNRNKRSAAIDIKSKRGIQTVLRLVGRADILIEGFRPGVTERLGLGPQDCWQVNPALIYGRITGWGQNGPLSQTAGHDLNYISLVGALHSIGRKGEPPAIPLNLVGDFGGGALYLAMGVLAALLESRVSGKGQVVDATMIDGVASLMTMVFSWKQMNAWTNERGSNLIDSGAPFYDVYETKDGKFISIAAVEKRFYEELLELAGLKSEQLPDQYDRDGWGKLRKKFAEVFKTKTRDEWCTIMEGSDACFAPVLDLDESTRHPHVMDRKIFVEIDGVINPAPAPRFERTQCTFRRLPPVPGQDSLEAMQDWGFSEADIHELKTNKVIM